jgi:hypothetical protein
MCFGVLFALANTGASIERTLITGTRDSSTAVASKHGPAVSATKNITGAIIGLTMNDAVIQNFSRLAGKPEVPG